MVYLIPVESENFKLTIMICMYIYFVHVYIFNPVGREYRMLYRGPGFFAVVWFAWSPTPLYPFLKLDRRCTGRPRKRDNLLQREGGWSQIIWRGEKAWLVLYKSCNTFRQCGIRLIQLYLTHNNKTLPLSTRIYNTVLLIYFIVFVTKIATIFNLIKKNLTSLSSTLRPNLCISALQYCLQPGRQGIL